MSGMTVEAAEAVTRLREAGESLRQLGWEEYAERADHMASDVERWESE